MGYDGRTKQHLKRLERAHLHTYSFLKPYFGVKSANLIRSDQDGLVIMYMQV